MSADAAQAGHHDAHSEGGHGSFKGYVTGFVLSVILTVIPFWLVMGRVLDSAIITALIILALGGVQMVVHIIYFLHMNTRSEHGWTFMALIFTVTLVVIMLSGSVWVMHHLNTNMMPMQNHEMMGVPMPAPPTQGQSAPGLDMRKDQMPSGDMHRHMH